MRLFPRAKATSRPSCGGCETFDADPRRLVEAVPGLLALSSADASVRSDDGICGLHGRFVSPRWCCTAHRPRPG